MNRNLMPEFSKPTILTAQHYDRKITFEIDHSDLNLDEVMDAFETLVIGMGFHKDSWKQWIIDRAEEYMEDDTEDLKRKLNDWKNDEDELRHSTDEHPHWDWDEESASKRMDIIGQNGNEGLHYDSDGFEDYQFDGEDYDGQFDEWDNETPEEFKPNKTLIDAKEQYDAQMARENKNKKNENKKKKRNSKG